MEKWETWFCIIVILSVVSVVLMLGYGLKNCESCKLKKTDEIQ
uniref:Uncharacterized protein n=1 Tax=viral metagenome TaxID=1070528 RepID=A0A6C0CIV9_9ZZZZ